MLYASSKAALVLALNGIYQQVQCTEYSELAFESVFEQVAPKGSIPVVKAAIEE